jgi:stage IV sporulation protein FB
MKLIDNLLSNGWTTGLSSIALCFLVFCLSLHNGNITNIILTIAALLIHEFSHMLCCELLEYPIQQFSLNLLGGCLKVDPSFIINPQAELLIASAGPIVNLLMVAGVLYLRLLGIDNYYLASWLQINLMIGIINLIPASPLDGGRILHSLLNKNFGIKNSFLIIKKLTLAIGLLFLFLGIALFFQKQTGTIYLFIAVFVLLQLFYFKNPTLNLILKTLQHKKKRLAKNGFLRVRPVIVEPTSLIRQPLQYYGVNDYLLFFIQDKDEKSRIISEESAWNSLINQGFDATFNMAAKGSVKASTNIYCRLPSDEVE